MWELARARQGVCEDVVGAREKLRSQADGEGLRPAQDLPSQGVEEKRSCATHLAKISHRCGVAAKEPPCDPAEMTGTGEDPVGQQAVPWRL